ncbi:MAG TPA: hypothetical protein VK689_02355, partial [Armatimonadota bacterium]|nr:hypothetical protein [Armatimonadota bacterium]
MLSIFKRRVGKELLELPEISTPEQRRVTVLVARITGIERLTSTSDLAVLTEVMRHFVGGLEAAVHAHG